MPSNHLILCHRIFLLPPIPPSIRVFSNESVLHTRWPKYWSFSFKISPSNEYSGLISSSMDWLDLLAVQETLKSLLQHHNLKTSILQLPFFKKRVFLTAYINIPRKLRNYRIHSTRAEFFGKRIKNKHILWNLKINFIKMLEGKVEQTFLKKSKKPKVTQEQILYLNSHIY